MMPDASLYCTLASHQVLWVKYRSHRQLRPMATTTTRQPRRHLSVHSTSTTMSVWRHPVQTTKLSPSTSSSPSAIDRQDPGYKVLQFELTHIVLAQLMLECFYPQAYILLHEQLNIVNSNTILYHSQEKRLSVFAGNQPRRHKLQNFKFGVIIRHGSQLGDHSSGILRGLSSRDLSTASKIVLLLSSYILTHLS